MSWLLRINSYLRHQTTTGLQLREFDAFRGWACLAVLSGHILLYSIQNEYISMSKRFIRFGGPGVHLFFFISGFLLYLKWGKSYYENKPEPSARSYFKRRLQRIVPAYLVNLILIISLSGVVFINPIFKHNGLTDIIQHLFFIHSTSVTNFYSINEVAWTLSIEMQYYLILPFIVSWFYGKRSFLSVPGVIFFSLSYCILSYTFINSYGELDFNLTRAVIEQLPTRLCLFVIGIAFANLWLYTRLVNKSAFLSSETFSNSALIIGFLSLFLLWYIRPVGKPVVDYIWSMAFVMSCGMIIWGTMQSSNVTVKAVIANPIIEFFGIISYSLYLWHWPVLMNIEYWLPMEHVPIHFKFLIVAAGTISISLIISLASYLLFEKPFLKVKNAASGC